MRALVAVVLGALGVVLIVAGVNGSAENLFTSLLGTSPAKKAAPGSGSGTAAPAPGNPNRLMPHFPGAGNIGAPVAS